jgi:hypothetical protein
MAWCLINQAQEQLYILSFCAIYMTILDTNVFPRLPDGMLNGKTTKPATEMY